MRPGRAVVAAAALLLAGCSGVPVADAGRAGASSPSGDDTTRASASSPRHPAGSTVTDVLDGQRVRLDLPHEGAATGVVLLVHGQYGDVDWGMGAPWVEALRARGWAIASGDLQGDAWGSPAAVAATVTLAGWAEAESGSPVRLLVGGSMGGLASLNALIERALVVDCWFGVEPVVDVASVSTVPSADQQVAGVYGGPPPAEANPAARLDRLPRSTRYAVVASPDDSWVPPSRHGDVLLAALGSAKADVSSYPATGPHGDPSHYRPELLVDFADGCG